MLDYLAGIKQVRAAMKVANIQYVLLGPSANMRYLSGIDAIADERMQLLLIPQTGQIQVVLPFMYQELAAHLLPPYQLNLYKNDIALQAVLSKILQPTAKIAVDDRLWSVHLLQLLPYCGQPTLVSAGDLISPLRIVKDAAEIACLQKAGAVADRAFTAAMLQVKAGITELEVASLLDNGMYTLGGEGLSFPTIVGFGANGADPHHHPDQTKLHQGDFIVMDFGCTVGGYCADTTRTVCLGAATAQQKTVYNLVKTAGEEAKKMVSAGITCGAVDVAARQIIDAGGYGEYFIHTIGHGVGLDVHEEPYMPINSPTVLKSGMVHSIEPGIYLPHQWGVRIEECVVVTDNGCLELNFFDKELIEL